jgi:hypothetical protein
MFLVLCSWFFVAKQEANAPNQAPGTKNKEQRTKNKEHS